ncbi:MAG: DEAD/DEAH box helicase [Candidatus Micrarchaeota archaeon]
METNGLSAELAKTAGYATPTEIQAKTLAPILAGGDVVARAPTGTGKTAAFAIPVLERILRKEISRAIVIEPSRELTIQAANETRKIAGSAAVRVVAAYGGTPPERQAELIKQGAQLVIGTPGRLRELLQSGVLKPGGVNCLVLDEADRLLGEQFSDDVCHIASRLPPQRQTLLFAVHMPQMLLAQWQEKLLRKEFAQINAKQGGDITHYYAVTGNKTKTLAEQLRIHPCKSLVFSTTTEGADQLAKELRFHGVYPLLLHSNRDSDERNSAVKRFKQTDGSVLVATDIAARGMHFPNVARVYSLEPTATPEGYLHRAGRTGRMEEKGECITLCTAGEVKKLVQTAKAVGIAVIELPPASHDR